MSKVIKMTGLAVLVVILGSLAVGAVAFAQGPFGDRGFGRFGPPSGPLGFAEFGARGPMGDWDDMKESLAEALGMSVEELDAELDSGKTIPEIAAARGISPEQLREAMQQTAAAALDKAVEEGRLTQEQADWIKNRMQNGPLDGGARGPMGGPLGDWDDMKETLAGALGISVEELETELDSGKTIPEIAEERGISQEQLQEAMQQTAAAALDKAVEEGKLTQEQANWIKDRMQNGPMGGPMGGSARGPMGGGGHPLWSSN